MRVPATFFDGQSAEAVESELELLGKQLRICFGSTQHRVDTGQSRLIAPVGKGPWAIELPQGGRIQFSDMDFGRELSRQYGRSDFVGWLEGSWHWALIALIISVAGAWLMLTRGVPVAARHIAFSMPMQLDEELSNKSIELLDRFMFQESRLETETKHHVRDLFDRIRRSDPAYQHFRLEFRFAEDMGANAFAIPGGLVIMTDGMVDLATKDEELVAVLAHEIGHLAYRHGLRILLQDAASAIIIAGLTGDLSNISALSATVPTVLMQAKYSRDFEREADGFSFAYLKAQGIDTAVLSSLLQRLENQAGRQPSGSPPSWFSSHPGSEERIPEDE